VVKELKISSVITDQVVQNPVKMILLVWQWCS